jgi:hypothetical protein
VGATRSELCRRWLPSLQYSVQVPMLGGVAHARDAAARPLGAEVLAPRRAALRHRNGAIADVGFDADLMQRVRRDALLAVSKEAANTLAAAFSGSAQSVSVVAAVKMLVRSGEQVAPGLDHRDDLASGRPLRDAGWRPRWCVEPLRTRRSAPRRRVRPSGFRRCCWPLARSRSLASLGPWRRSAWRGRRPGECV